MEMKLDYSDSLVDHLVDKGFSEKYGARNLRRLIQTEVEDAIANEIVKNYNDPFKKISVGIKNDKVTVKTKK